MGVLPGIGGLVGKKPRIAFGAYHVSSHQVGSGSSLTVTVDTPREDPTRVFAVFVSNKGGREFSSFQINGSGAGAVRETLTGNNLTAGIGLAAAPEGLVTQFGMFFSGSVSNNGYVDIYELIGVTITGRDAQGKTIASGTGILQSGPANWAGGMSLSHLVVDGQGLSSNPQHAPIQLQSRIVNSSYSYRAGLWVPDTTDTSQTFGAASLTSGGAKTFMAVGLQPAS